MGLRKEIMSNIVLFYVSHYVGTVIGTTFVFRWFLQHTHYNTFNDSMVKARITPGWEIV